MGEIEVGVDYANSNDETCICVTIGPNENGAFTVATCEPVDRLLIPNERGYGQPMVRCSCGGEPKVAGVRNDSAFAVHCEQCDSYGPIKTLSAYGQGAQRAAQTAWNCRRLQDLLGLSKFPLE